MYTDTGESAAMNVSSVLIPRIAVCVSSKITTHIDRMLRRTLPSNIRCFVHGGNELNGESVHSWKHINAPFIVV